MIDWYTKTVLTVIALSLLALALRDVPAAQAQGRSEVRVTDIRSLSPLRVRVVD